MVIETFVYRCIGEYKTRAFKLQYLRCFSHLKFSNANMTITFNC